MFWYRCWCALTRGPMDLRVGPATVLLHETASLSQTLAAVMILVVVLYAWFLLAWAYSRALVGAMARPFAIWRPRPRRRDDGDVFENWWM